MGIPSFYRWLANKYPKIVSDAVENEDRPEFDNLYLDMNGIIHPCFHPEDNLFPPTTFEEVFNNMYEYIDHLFHIVRPKKLLFMAIDGVAPRAKMNQQRARRFRTAKDAEIAEEMEEKLRRQFESEGKVVLPKQESEIGDSNVITPGTEFMHMLSDKLQSYIARRMRENPAWAKIKVILSDDKVPGEGEHKIMSFIRSQRSAIQGYDPNTRHCLYGLDADLIMLALATHEIHFCILREEVLPPNNQINIEPSLDNPCQMMETNELNKLALCEKPWLVKTKKQSYQFLNLCILREYLALDLEVPSSDNIPGNDLERLLDDFIFICFFAGNDFLPHMPTLEIHEDCIDLLMHVYKNEFPNLGGYLVDMQNVDDKKGSYIKLKRVERFILAVGAFEEQIFTKRSNMREKKLRRMLNDFREAKEFETSQLEDEMSSDLVGMHAVSDLSGLKISDSPEDPDAVLKNTKELKQKIKEYIRNQSDLFRDGIVGSDKVRLGSQGFKERYYKEKFSADTPQEMEAIRKNVVEKYVEGLCWVLLYYFSGVPSWTWFYPFHYGPFASDLRGLSRTNTKFNKGSPFKPFDQLMGVLPPRSAHALPAAFKGLMSDEESTIIDFYPSVFTTDVDGKRFLWQGICKLPFIDEERLLVETKKLEHELKEYEKVRNSQTLDRLFVRCPIEQLLSSGARQVSEKIKDAVTIESRLDGVKGTLHLMMPDEFDAQKDDAVKDFCMFFETLQCSRNVPRLLEGVNIPEKTVEEEDIMETILWHERFGNTTMRYQNPKAAAVIKRGEGFNLGRGKMIPNPYEENVNIGGRGRSLRPAGQCMPRNSYPGIGNNAYQVTSNVGGRASRGQAYQVGSNFRPVAQYQVRSDARPFGPVGQYQGRSDTRPFRTVGQYQEISDVRPFRPVVQYQERLDVRPFVPISQYQERSDARSFRPDGQYQERSDARSFRPIGQYQGRSDAHPFRPVGQCQGRSDARPFRPVSQYQGRSDARPFMPVGHYQGRSNAHPFSPVSQYRETSVTYEERWQVGYGGRGVHPNANNVRPQQGGGSNIRHPPPQHWRPTFDTTQGRGHGEGRSGTNL